MHKVLIVDDEMLVRKRLIFGFDWGAMGYKIEDEAEDGENALILLEKKSYDLAIVDIDMPGITGIDLARMVKEKKIPVHVVFLTGHSEFKYAQEAVRYGIHYYILKPICEEEFKTVLKKLAEVINEEKRNIALQNQADAVMESKVFSDLLHESVSLEEMDAGSCLFSQYGVLESESYYMALYRIDIFLKENYKIVQKLNTVSEVLSSQEVSKDQCMMFYDMYRDYIVILMRLKKCVGEEVLLQSLLAVREELEFVTSMGVQCGVSIRNKGVRELNKAYTQAVSALNNGKISKNPVVFYKDVEKQEESHYKIPEQIIKNLCKQIGNLDFETCQQVVRTIFEDMFQREISFECMVANVNRLLLKLFDMGVLPEKEVLYNFVEVFDHISDMEDVISWFEQIIFALIEGPIRQATGNKSLSIIQKACEFIQDHYSDMELNQTVIAEAMSVTQSYISAEFKKTMGISMMQYITRARMEKAQEMLLTGELEVNEVAKVVGYGDEYYFSRCFKKYHGLSPLQVKKIAGTRRVKCI